MTTLFRLLIVALIAVTQFAWSQSGNYFLSHYSPSKERFNYICFDMAQDNKGVMYYATKAGILEFDGRDWDLLSAPSAIYSLQVDKNGLIYWSGTKGFGKVELDKHGFKQIITLSDSTVSNVFQSLLVKDEVFYLTEEYVYRLNTKDGKIDKIKKSKPEDSFLKLFELFGATYASTLEGIFKINKSSLEPSSLNILGEVVFSQRFENHYVIATSENKIFSIDESLDVKPVTLKDQAYLDASVITSGTWLNRQLLSIGTLRGGVVFVNPLNGITEEIINYSTGLPDNEVFGTMKDSNENVWVAHDYGFTKISPYIPLRSFSHYQGLQGNLLCAYSTSNTVYVGTSLGLYKLEKLDVYDELVYYQDVPVSSSSNKASTQKTAAVQEAPSDSKKGGLFNFLKRKNKNNSSATAKNDDTEEAENQPPAKQQYKRIRRTEKVIRSSQYSFKKVQGIDAKVTHLTEVKGRLLAAGLGGFYEVNNLTAKTLIDEPIRFIYSPTNSDLLIISTYADEVRTIRFDGNIMENSSLFSSLEDQIHYVFEGKNELWLCGIDKIYRADIRDGDVRHKQTVELTQRNIDRTVGVVINGNVVLVNADGFYKLDRQTSKIIPIDSLSRPSQYYAHKGSIVYHDQHGWKILGSSENQNQLSLLNVFEDIRFITSDKNPNNLWLISGENELFKFFGENSSTDYKEYPLYLKSIFYQGKKIVNHSEIHMDQEHSSVSFKVVQPDYVNPKAIEFRWQLKGMQQGWSDWSSTNNVINVPFMPNGEYTLEVQARNIFGTVTDLDPVSFEVLPPYWRTPWFYAMEFSIFASLVMLSFRLSTRYRIVSRVLSLLTIILMIEFIQTIIGESILTKNSPVIDFFIQVIVALLILPVEGFLRKLMLNSLDSSTKFYQFMVPKSPVAVRKPKEEFFEESNLRK